MNKKYIIVSVVTILILSIGVSLAYWTARLKGEGTPMSFSTGDLRIIFNKKEDGDLTSDIPIEPGWSVSKTFSVASESDTIYKYNIILKDCINTFKTTGFLQYKITSTNGYNMTEYKDVPKSETASNQILSKEISIEPNETHEYTIEFRYIETEEDQSEDMGATLSGTLFIEEYRQKTLHSILSDGEKYEIGTITDFSTPVGGTEIQDGYNSTGKIYKTGSDYYFRGNPSDNWVKFAGKYWRIIRSNSSEGTRLLYAGTSPEGQDGYINNTTYKWYSSNNNAFYVEWISAAPIISALDSWYNSNITGTNANMLNTNTTYCNDTSYKSQSSWGTNGRSFGAYSRLIDAKTPSYACSTNGNTTHTTIGLMTADEVAYSGGVYEIKAPNTYYYRNSKANGCTGTSGDPCSVTGDNIWWTMSPWGFLNGNALVFYVRGATHPGYLSGNTVNGSHAVRPVVTLKSSVLVSGSGTAEDPYVPNL